MATSDERREDEIEALEAIYADELVVDRASDAAVLVFQVCCSFQQ